VTKMQPGTKMGVLLVAVGVGLFIALDLILLNLTCQSKISERQLRRVNQYHCRILERSEAPLRRRFSQDDSSSLAVGKFESSRRPRSANSDKPRSNVESEKTLESKNPRSAKAGFVMKPKPR